MFGAIKMIMFVKGVIKDLIKKTGKDSVDVLCMFLAGDMLGIAIHAIGGLVVKMWRYIKDVGLFRMIFGLVKALMSM